MDGDPFARKLMRDSLSLSGEDYQILETDKGWLALELIAAERPNLVLLDLATPGIPGLSIFTEIRGNPTTAGLPVIIVSADAGSRLLGEAVEAGATDCLTKPFQPEALARRARRALDRQVAA